MPADLSLLGQEVEISLIESSLRDLWASNDAVSKASLINFAIYSENPASLDANTRLIEAVTAEHACRAILIAAQPNDGPAAARSWITAHCQLGGWEGKSICSEQIAFQLTGQLRDLLRNIVFAHLESDLPLVLYWQGDFTERWEAHLYRHIDRLVIDSGRWSHPLAQAAKLRAAWKSKLSHFMVLDLVWMRLFSWRLALAGAFDESAAREKLGSLERLDITHAPGHGLAARLFAAWVLERVSGVIAPPQPRFQEREGSPVSRIELTGTGVRLTLTREPGSGFVLTHIETARGVIDQITPAVPDDDAALVSERLSRGANNPLYFKLWRAVKSLL